MTCVFDTRADVLHGISFDILSGEVTGLLGPNGAGKSTTLKILTGILKAPEGIAEIEGYKLPQEAFEAKQRIGYVPESAELCRNGCLYFKADSSRLGQRLRLPAPPTLSREPHSAIWK